MKTLIDYKNIGLLLTAIIALSLASCNPDDKTDSDPPGKLSVNTIIPTHGGAKITYTLPDDDDVLFVKAKYTNSLGHEVFKVSSVYSDTIEVDGFNDVAPHAISLYVVDRNDNHSEATEAQVTPLVSYIYLVQESLEITPGLGGVNVKWDNVSAKTVHVYLLVKNDSYEDSVILSSYLPEYQTTLRGLDSVNYDFYARVEDFPGNRTDQKFITSAKPRFEQKIDKSTWTLVSELSADGNAWEGATVNFWDDVIDTRDNPDDNSYFIMNRDDNGGALNYPMDIVIDLNKQVIMNRFIVWQRAYWYTDGTDGGASANYYYYQSENMRMFDLFTSNDKVDWALAGSFDIGDPKDADGNVPAAAIQEAIEGHMFSLERNTEPFRYLKFSITSNYGSEQNLYGSEITLYGLDNVVR